MEKLVFTRIKRNPITDGRQAVVRINAKEYNKVLEIADETGLSLYEIVNRMVNFAYENVSYQSN